MWASIVASRIRRIITPPAIWSKFAGVIALGLIAIVVFIDVMLRAFLRWPIPGNIEIVAYLLVIVFFSAYAHAELMKKHICVEALTSNLPPKTKALIVINGMFASMGIATVLCLQSIRHAEFLWSGHIVTGMLRLPEWPLLIFSAFFFLLFFFSILVNFLEQLTELYQNDGMKAYFWLLPGILLTSGLCLLTFSPSLIFIELTPGMWGIVIFIFLFVLVLLNIPVAIAMGLASLLGISYIMGTGPTLANISMSLIAVAGDYTWSMAPLFLWMGLIASYAGFAKEAYDASYKWVGRFPGGLASSNIVACTVLAAVTGSPQTGVLTLGTIGLPHMRAYKYDMKLATGSICAGSCLGSLIPPSIPLVVYGMLTENSIGKLFIAGILPGVLLSSMLILTVTLMCHFNPKLGSPAPPMPWKDRLLSLKGIWTLILLVLFLLGGLYGGIFTPTEAGAIGCVGAIIIGIMRRSLSFKNLINSTSEAVTINVTLMFIFIMATAFIHFFTLSNLTTNLGSWISELGLSYYGVFAIIVIIYLILGCVMNSLPAVMLTIPVLYPMAMAVNIDPILLGIIIVVMVDLGQLTPPIGMNVFAMAAIAKDVPMSHIFIGTMPFWFVLIACVIILVLFPQISLFLVQFM